MDEMGELESVVKKFTDFALASCEGLSALYQDAQADLKTFLDTLKHVMEFVPNIIEFVQGNSALMHLCNTFGAFVTLVLWIKRYMDACKVFPLEEASLVLCIKSACIDVQEAANITDEIQKFLQDEKRQVTLTGSRLSYVITKMGNVSGCLVAANYKLEAGRQHINSLIASQRSEKQVVCIVGGVLLTAVSVAAGVATSVIAPPASTVLPFGVGAGCAVVSNATMVLAMQNGFKKLNDAERNFQTNFAIIQANLKKQQENEKFTTTTILTCLQKNAEAEFIKLGIEKVSKTT